MSDSEDEKKFHDGQLDLGFLERPFNPEALLRYHFPCKVGGKPAWLNPRNLPQASQLTCDSCGKMLIFLLQMYAPISTDPRLYHRTLYIFICLDGSCLHRLGSIKVVRSQLPQVNPFYPLEPPELEEVDEDDEDEDPDNPVQAKLNFEDVEWPGAFLCALCGSPGAKACAGCRSVHYCSRAHQMADWKLGHNVECKVIKQRKAKQAESKAVVEFSTLRGSGSERYHELGSELSRRRQAYLFKQKEITLEEEHLDVSLTEREQAMVNKLEKEERKLSEKQKEEELNELLDSERRMKVDELGATQDAMYNAFLERISHDQSQVLRYHLGGDPLWVGTEQRPTSSDIKACSCGATRRFEFQVMPQLLDFLIDDCFSHSTMDWGTLAIYTCPDNCGDGLNGYMTETVWNQRMPELRSDPRVREKLDKLTQQANQKVTEVEDDDDDE